MDIRLGQEFNIYENGKRVAERVPVTKILKTRFVLKGGRKFRLKATKDRETRDRVTGAWQCLYGKAALSEIDGPGYLKNSDQEEREELWMTYSELSGLLSAKLRSSSVAEKRILIRKLQNFIKGLDR